MKEKEKNTIDDNMHFEIHSYPQVHIFQYEECLLFVCSVTKQS